MQYTIFDIETNGLLDNVTKIHCLSYQKFNSGVLIEKNSLTNYEDIKNFVQAQSILVGHNIIRYDLPVIEKLLSIIVPKEIKIIDTLGLSWYLYSSYDTPKKGKKISHGLETWGEILGVEKPKINDWSNLSIEEYINRCSEDVEINQLLFHKEFLLLRKLYGKDYWRIINYITFKMDCLREQEFTKCKIDIDLLNKSLEELNSLYEEKEKVLASVMPKKVVYKIISKPSKMYKKDGSLSSLGEKWFNLLSAENLPEDYEGEVSITFRLEEPNPGSTDQLKDFLFSLDWKPITFKDGSNGKVPQILDDSKRVCKSVRDLYPLCPELETLDQMSLIKHRIGVFKAFKDSLDSNNYVEATANGFTNTMRFMHSKPVANLVKVGKFYGEQIRGLITVPNENYLFCGSDCSALEDTTKQNYMFKYDPEYVTQMRTPGFDPHIDIAVLSGLMSKEESEEFKRLKKLENQTEEEHNEYVRLNSIRSKAKVVNFCLPTDKTEVLTIDGWKNYNQLSLSDKIFSYNTETDELEVVNIESIPFFSNQEVIEISNSTFNFECTPNHKWFSNKRVRLKNGATYFKKHFVETADIKTDDNIIVSSCYKNQNNKYNINDIRLLAWILTEGYIKWSNKLGGTSNSFGKKRDVICTIGQKDNKEDLEEILSNFEYRSYQRKDGLVYYNVLSKEIRSLFERLNLPQLNKKEIDYTNLIIDLSYELREEFITHILKGDGYTRKNQKVLTQNKGNILNAFCLALTLNGYFYNLSKGRTYNDNICVDVYIRNRRHITGQKLSKTFNRYTDVFCVNNKNKTFIAKQNDKVVITGNSSIYGAGAPKIAETLKSDLDFAKALHTTYWNRNKAVKQTSENFIIRIMFKDGSIMNYRNKNLLSLKFQEQQEFTNKISSMWLLNPYSKLLYPLRYFKDAFSTGNQGLGVWCFDNYVREVRKRGIKISLQYHDK